MSREFLVCAAVLASGLSGCIWAPDEQPRSRPVAIDPVCGTAVDPSTPWRGRFRQQVYYFHSDQCREQFYAEPEYYAGGYRDTRRDPRVYRNQVYYSDPVCGRDVPSTRWRHEYGGRTYYFHDNECLMEFRYRPQAYSGGYRKGNYEAR